MNLEDRPDKRTKRYNEIVATSNRVNELLKENMHLFNMQDSQDIEIWLNYVTFIDALMEETIFKTVACRYDRYPQIFIIPIYYYTYMLFFNFSMAYISEHINLKNKLAPLFEAQLELLDPDMVFSPTLDPNDEKGFTALIQSIIDDVLKMASLIERIDSRKHETYEQFIVSSEEIIEMKEEILNAIEKVGKYRKILESIQ